MGGRRLRFTDTERRRLARKAQALGRKGLNELETLVTPDTLITASEIIKDSPTRCRSLSPPLPSSTSQSVFSAPKGISTSSFGPTIELVGLRNRMGSEGIGILASTA